MTTIIFLALILLVTNGLTGFLVFKGVQLGLRWQVETKQEIQPTMGSPITPIIEAKKEKEQTKVEQDLAKEQATIFKEWLSGKEE